MPKRSYDPVFELILWKKAAKEQGTVRVQAGQDVREHILRDTDQDTCGSICLCGTHVERDLDVSPRPATMICYSCRAALLREEDERFERAMIAQPAAGGEADAEDAAGG